MRDGHIHSPYCPHGTSDSLKSYIEHAITIGYKTMSFTEHAPLPPSFEDPVPNKDSGMSSHKVEDYLRDLHQLKATYKKDLSINIGFEIDFIHGFEKETEQFLNQYGPETDDNILSVHFIPGNKQWYCIDYSPEMYLEAMEDLGNGTLLYQAYYEALTESARVDLGPFKPRRIGHMTLIRKFHNLYPSPENWEEYAKEFLNVVKKHQLELDYNSAGTQKPHCKETYPSHSIAKQASSMGIPLIYGSDAHTSLSLKQGFDQIKHDLL